MVVSEQELLNPKEQDAVLQDIALVLAHNLPPGWQECLAVHGALGAHGETTIRIERLNGPPTDVEGPQVLGELFARLRTGMYRPGVGTWLIARFRLTHPVEYRVEYDNTGQPDWSTPPPSEAYSEELLSFPRDPEHIPDWMRRSAEVAVNDQPGGQDGESAAPAAPSAPTASPDGQTGRPADAAAPGFQMARVFDSLGPGQTPQVNRPPVPDDEVEAVADYLTKAPMVLAARSLDEDLLDPARPAKVPLTYLTDGTWIWPGGVGYYLRTHGVPPEPELVEHIRRQGFQPREIDDYTRDVAVAAIMGQPPPPRPAATSASEAPADEAPADEAPADEAGQQEPAAPAETAPEKVSDETAPVGVAPVDVAPVDVAPVGVAPVDVAPVGVAVPDRDARALERLRARLAELGADPASYGIEIIIDGAWCLVREGAGWSVFRTADGDRAVSVAFPSADQAAAFLLGSVLMAADRPARSRGPDAPPVTQPDLRRPARTYDGPIEPLSGEPPVTLFRNLRELELVAGTEIDRVGDPAGNLTYAAGTQYSQRSLPPEWANRPHHVYRLQQPLRVLIGTAVPWFDQPGGGTGYFLPVSVAELLADGALVEIEPTRK